MSIAGTWYNELGSTMNVSASGSSIGGTYVTAVGAASGTYIFQGRLNPYPASGASGQAVAWAVAWVNAYANSSSATGWSGQYQPPDASGGEQIVALWYLANSTTPSNEWQSTLAGKDVFTRTPPTAEQIEAAKATVAPSHPVEEPGPSEGDPDAT